MLLFYTAVLGLLHVQHVLCQDESMDFLQASEMEVMPSELPYVMTEFPGVMETSQDFLVTNYVQTAVMQPSSSPVDILPSSVAEVVQVTSSVTEILTTETQTATGTSPTTSSEDLLTTGATSANLNIVTTAALMVCLDRTDDCPVLGLSVCTDFRDWSRYYCPQFCDECDNIAMTPPTGGPLPQQTTEPTTETPTETTTELITEPPTTEPPTTEPPTTEPITEPPTTVPPTTEPPTTEPPTTEAITEPPTTEPPTTEPVTPEATTEACCTDQIGWERCLDYHEESCQEPYRAWASQRCQAFCGMCKPCPIEPCEDALPNCVEYGTDSCFKVNFRKWAMQNCRRHCGLCTNYGFYYQLNNLTAPTYSGPTSGSGGSTSGPSGPVVGSTAATANVCEDKVINCTEYGLGDCAQYSKFMSAYCPRYCSFCSDTGSIGVSEQPITPGGGSGTVTGVTDNPDIPGGCGDKVSNCTSLAKENCCGIYEPWARAHCASYCGFCGVVPDRICDDRIDYCDRMNDDMCTNDVFRLFRESNCAGFCKLCDTPWEPPTCTAHLFHPVPTDNVPTNMVG